MYLINSSWAQETEAQFELIRKQVATIMDGFQKSNYQVQRVRRQGLNLLHLSWQIGTRILAGSSLLLRHLIL